MTGSSLARVGRAFHRGAPQYDLHTPVQQRVVRRLLELTCRLLGKGGAQQVLDIGCGTGQLLTALADCLPQAALTGLDLAPDMLRLAGERLSNRATLIQGDAERLPFAAARFDLVLSSSTFQWLERCDLCFSEAHRVLQQGGTFCFALFGDGTLAELHSSWQEALRRSGRSLPPGRDGTHRFHDAATIRHALVSQGFQQVMVTREREEVWYPDLPRMLQAIKRIGAGTARPPAGGGLGWRQTLHEMAAIYEERFGAERGVPAGYQVIYGAGRR